MIKFIIKVRSCITGTHCDGLSLNFVDSQSHDHMIMTDKHHSINIRSFVENVLKSLNFIEGNKRIATKVYIVENSLFYLLDLGSFH